LAVRSKALDRELMRAWLAWNCFLNSGLARKSWSYTSAVAHRRRVLDDGVCALEPSADSITVNSTNTGSSILFKTGRFK
jgi:hypothetical protein